MQAVCLLQPDSIRVRNNLATVLNAGDIPFVFAESWEDALGKLRPKDILIIDYDLCAEARGHLNLSTTYFTIMFASRPIPSLSALPGSWPERGCVLGVDEKGDFAANLVLAALQKNQSESMFGLGHYLLGAGSEYRTRISNFLTKQEALRELTSFVERLGVDGATVRYKEYASRTRTLADELLLAAEASGSTGQQGPEFAWSFDGRWLGISVTFGPSGARYEDTFKSLLGGEGQTCGLFESPVLRYVFERAQHLVINNRAGAKTEVIVLVHFFRRLKDVTNLCKGLHFFC